MGTIGSAPEIRAILTKETAVFSSHPFAALAPLFLRTLNCSATLTGPDGEMTIDEKGQRFG